MTERQAVAAAPSTPCTPGFIACSCWPRYSQLWGRRSGKLNTAFLPPAARYCSWKVLLVRRVKPSRNFALKLSPPSSSGLPLPQYTHSRVLLATSLLMLTIGSLRFHAGSLDGPHMSSDLYPPASFIDMPTSVGHQPSDRFRNPDREAA